MDSTRGVDTGSRHNASQSRVQVPCDQSEVHPVRNLTDSTRGSTQNVEGGGEDFAVKQTPATDFNSAEHRKIQPASNPHNCQALGVIASQSPSPGHDDGKHQATMPSEEARVDATVHSFPTDPIHRAETPSGPVCDYVASSRVSSSRRAREDPAREAQASFNEPATGAPALHPNDRPCSRPGQHCSNGNGDWITGSWGAQVRRESQFYRQRNLYSRPERYRSVDPSDSENSDDDYNPVRRELPPGRE